MASSLCIDAEADRQTAELVLKERFLVGGNLQQC